MSMYPHILYPLQLNNKNQDKIVCICVTICKIIKPTWNLCEASLNWKTRSVQLLSKQQATDKNLTTLYNRIFKVLTDSLLNQFFKAQLLYVQDCPSDHRQFKIVMNTVSMQNFYKENMWFLYSVITVCVNAFYSFFLFLLFSI